MGSVNLESGPATGLKSDVGYFALLTLVCAAMSLWFYRDYAWGYVENNRETARKTLTSLLGAENLPAELGDRPRESDFESLLERLRLNPTADRTTAVVEQALGGPARHTKREPNGETIAYYFSDWGMATVTYRNERIAIISDASGATSDGLKWQRWKHTYEEVQSQFTWMLIPGVAALYTLSRSVRASRVRVRLDGEALHYGGRKIPLESMQSLRDYSKKGWVDLYYGTSGQKLRIDNQKVAKFDELIRAICDATGFPDPRTPQPDAAAAAENSPS